MFTFLSLADTVDSCPLALSIGLQARHFRPIVKKGANRLTSYCTSVMLWNIGI
jgi:hypothetical protein